MSPSARTIVVLHMGGCPGCRRSIIARLDSTPAGPRLATRSTCRNELSVAAVLPYCGRSSHPKRIAPMTFRETLDAHLRAIQGRDFPALLATLPADRLTLIMADGRLA